MVTSIQEVREIIRYKELLRNLVLRDIKKRYKRSALGFLWVMLDPLLMMLIFYFVFSGLFGKAVGNYTAYVMSGIAMWQLFAQGTKVSALAFVLNRNLINKIYLPKAVFPLSVVASSLVHFMFSLIPLFAIILFSGVQLNPNIVLLPLVVFLVFAFSFGISLAVATLAVFFHDVIFIYDVLLMAWMYLSAIFYPVTILPENLQALMQLNPVYHYITLFRACLYDTSIDTVGHFIIGAVFAAFFLLAGWSMYHRNKDKIVFYL